MCRSCGGTLAVSGSYVEGAMRCAGAYGRPPEGARQAPAAPLDAGACLVVALCVLRPASAWGVLLRQNPTASEISDARFRAIYSGMRKLPPGSVLNKTASSTAGTCIPECTGRYAENCEAGMCTASIGGSKYCSKCKSGYVPVDGICVLAETARAAPAGCTPNSNDGVCTACTEKYFLESGGCYQAEKFPGNTLCTTADAGKCTTCANGQDKDSNGSCPACPANCASCAKDSGKTCTKCFSGYYLDANKACKKYSETSGNIQGVPNCISCLAPTSPQSSTPVTCYVAQEPTVDPTDPSVNRGGLSTGAIAGISVVAVLVVSALIGFLCWWFLCKTRRVGVSSGTTTLIHSKSA